MVFVHGIHVTLRLAHGGVTEVTCIDRRKRHQEECDLTKQGRLFLVPVRELFLRDLFHVERGHLTQVVRYLGIALLPVNLTDQGFLLFG